MAPSQSLFSASSSSNPSKNHSFIRQADGVIYEYRLLTPVDHIKQLSLSPHEDMVTLPLPTTSAVSSASLPHQTGPPSLPEAIRNAPRRRQ